MINVSCSRCGERGPGVLGERGFAVAGWSFSQGINYSLEVRCNHCNELETVEAKRENAEKALKSFNNALEVLSGSFEERKARNGK